MSSDRSASDPKLRNLRRGFGTSCSAEGASFAVALASCLAKYVRETCMHAFHAYFTTFQPGLRPTAGYTTDGRRWIQEAGVAIERSRIRPEALIRAR